MKLSNELLRQIRSDLGLNTVFIKGHNKTVYRCWHFYTDGRSVDYLFKSRQDFICGMNRIYFIVRRFKVVILAFCLMDTHIHFILYGEFEDCLKCIMEFLRRTAQYSVENGDESHKLGDIQISHQQITDDFYLKTAICYVLKNPLVGGIPYNTCDYPWSSGALYFRKEGEWTSPMWTNEDSFKSGDLTARKQRYLFRTKEKLPKDTRVMPCGLIFPGEYIANEVVESLFCTCKGFNYFMCFSKESDIESRGGTIANLSIPMQELQQHRDELCVELFGIKSTRHLDTTMRLKLAKTLKARYNCSVKQICRVAGLIYSEVETLI